MTDKEQIIIDGKKEKVNILFECNHIEDIEAFDMIKQGIEITPQNAPVGDFKIKIISNIHSPYGFSSICSRSKKSEDWEYMGFGHSGACSVTTALLKALQRKEQECESLKEEIEVLKDNFDTATRDCNELIEELKQECEELKEELNGSEKWRIKAESLNEKLDIKNTRYLKALEEIEEHYKKVIKNLTTCDDSHDANISIEALHNISDIINKAKGQ